MFSFIVLLRVQHIVWAVAKKELQKHVMGPGTGPQDLHAKQTCRAVLFQISHSYILGY